MGGKQSKTVTKNYWKNKNIELRQSKDRCVASSSDSFKSEKYLTKSVSLHKAALMGDWTMAEDLITNNYGLISSNITESGETALHLASVEGRDHFVENLLKNLDEKEVGIRNKKGITALTFAAAVGHLDIAKNLVEKNPMLPMIAGDDGVTSLYMAASSGHKEMAKFLFPKSGFESWKIEDQIELLTTSIESGLYGLALKIVNAKNVLCGIEDCNGELPLQVLARKPQDFRSNGNFGHTILSHRFPVHDEYDNDIDAYTLFGFLWGYMTAEDDIESAKFSENTSRLLFVAAESGNDNFLVELITQYPDFLYKANAKKQSIFHIAVIHRYVETFNLIYELSGVNNLIASYIDIDGNNMLHLAAKLAPPNQLNLIQGPALQMQLEVLWYKEVEKIVQPAYRNKKNNKGETPHDLFIAEHTKLMREGEKMMKQTAKACMLVSMLIVTVVFPTAFTVPDGYDKSSPPTPENAKWFMFFPISEVVAALSSFISMLMFLSILTSPYTKDEFLIRLPSWLIIGIASLFVSIVALMMAFCTCLLFYQHQSIAIIALLLLFGSVPFIFVCMKYPLLISMLRSTYGCHSLFESKNRLLSPARIFSSNLLPV